MSRFSTIRGIPVAVFGALSFVAATLLAMTGLVARQSVRENVPGYLFVLSTLSLALALTLAVLFFAGAATTLAFFPREGVLASGDSAAAATSTAPVPTQDQRSE